MRPTFDEIKEFDELNEKDIDVWENGDVGKSPKHMQKVEPEVKEAFLNVKKNMMPPTSIRLSDELRVALKTLAASNGLSYQSYVRMVLIQHIKEKLAN